MVLLSLKVRTCEEVPVKKDPFFGEYFRVWRPKTSTSKETSAIMALINSPSEPKCKNLRINGNCSVGPNR